MAYIPVPPDQMDRQAALQQSPLTGGSPAQLPPPPPRPPATAPAPYPGYMSPQDLAAFALQTIQQAYQPQLDYLRQQQRQSEQMHAAQQAGLVELYKILAGNMGSLGGDITNIFSNAAQGLNLPSDAVTGDLGVSRDIVGSGAAAGPGYGTAYPQLAGQQGQTEFLRAVQEGAAADQDIGAQIQKLVAEQPAQVQQLLQQLTGQQADYAKAAQPIIRSAGGAIVAIDPVTGKTQVIYEGAADRKIAGYDASLSAQVGYLVDKNRQPILDAKGKSIPYTAKTSSSQPTNTGPFYRDPVTGEWGLKPGYKYGPNGTVVKTTGAGAGKKTNTGPFFHNPVTGQWELKPGYEYGPNGTVVKTGGKTGGGTGIYDSTGTEITKGQVKSYSQDTVATIRAGLQHGGSLEQIIASLQKSPIPTAVWRSVVAKRFGVPTWAVRGVKSEGQMSQLRYMGVSRLHNIAVFLGYQPDPAHLLDKRGLIDWIRGHVPKAEAAATGGNQNASAVAKSVVDTAVTAIGKPYVWGAESPSQGFDCSGLLYWAFGQHGISLPRTSQEMWKIGTSVPKSDLRPGDAVFWKGYTGGVGGPGHVGIYIGNGKVLVAPSTGEFVRVEDLTRHSGYMGARRFTGLGTTV